MGTNYQEIEDIANQIYDCCWQEDEFSGDAYSSFDYNKLKNLKENVGIEKFSEAFIMYADNLNQQDFIPLENTINDIINQETSVFVYSNSNCLDYSNESIELSIANLIEIYKDLGVQDYINNVNSFIEENNIDTQQLNGVLGYINKNESAKETFDKLNTITDFNRDIELAKNSIKEFVNGEKSLDSLDNELKNIDYHLIGIAYEDVLVEKTSINKNLDTLFADRQLIDMAIHFDFIDKDKTDVFNAIRETENDYYMSSNFDLINNIIEVAQAKNLIQEYINENITMEEFKDGIEYFKENIISTDELYMDDMNSVYFDDIAIAIAFKDTSHYYSNFGDNDKLKEIYDELNLQNNYAFNHIMTNYIGRMYDYIGEAALDNQYASNEILNNLQERMSNKNERFSEIINDKLPDINKSSDEKNNLNDLDDFDNIDDLNNLDDLDDFEPDFEPDFD